MSYFSRPHGGNYDDLGDDKYWETRAISVDGCKNYVVQMGVDYWDWLEILAESEERPIEEFYRAATRSLYRAGTPPERRGSAISVSLAYQIELAFQRFRKKSLGYSNDDFWGDTIIIRTGGDPVEYYGVPPRPPRPQDAPARPAMRHCGSPIFVLSIGFNNFDPSLPANDIK